ncbi:MAG: hypothetical protein KGQ66_02110, partial [Acidobacteriota bacterium]|nr:hypothetical protein [Acidobacteriota bacterium]
MVWLPPRAGAGATVAAVQAAPVVEYHAVAQPVVTAVAGVPGDGAAVLTTVPEPTAATMARAGEVGVAGRWAEHSPLTKLGPPVVAAEVVVLVAPEVDEPDPAGPAGLALMWTGLPHVTPLGLVHASGVGPPGDATATQPVWKWAVSAPGTGRVAGPESVLTGVAGVAGVAVLTGVAGVAGVAGAADQVEPSGEVKVS